MVASGGDSDWLNCVKHVCVLIGLATYRGHYSAHCARARSINAPQLSLAQLPSTPLHGRMQTELLASLAVDAPCVVQALPSRELANLLVALDVLSGGDNIHPDVAAVLQAARVKINSSNNQV